MQARQGAAINKMKDFKTIPVEEQLEYIRKGAVEIPVVLAMNKADLIKPTQALPHQAAYHNLLPDAEPITFSAATGEGRGCGARGPRSRA